MADLGHKLTDEMLDGLEDKIADEYALATREMHIKLAKYLEKFSKGKAEQKALFEAGEISEKDYKDWLFRHVMMGKQWREVRDVLAEDLQHARQIALQMSSGKMADVYALNANYATYQIEHDFELDTAFTLYNHDTAEYLMGDTRQLMPGPSTALQQRIAADKSMQWDMQKIQSAVLQGVLQGESPDEVAKRLRGVAQMDYNASVRYARTMTTSAQNAGRYQAYRRASKLGVDLTIEWQATLDGRTRHDHRMMHGQRRNVDEPFKLPSGEEILYPADSSGDSYALQGEIWNCRCTLLSWVKGFEGDTVKSSPKMGGMSFDEWQHAKEPKPKAEPEVIQMTFADQIAAIKQRLAGAVPTEDDLHEAGKILGDEYAKEKAERQRLYDENVPALKTEYDRLNKAEDAAYDKAWDVRRKYRRGEATREEWEAAENEYKRLEAERKAARTKWREAESKYGFKGKQSADWLRDKVGETREMGSSDFDIRKHLYGSKSAVVPDIEYAYSHYPKDWVGRSVADSGLTPRKVSRGHYSHYAKELYISGSGDGAIETAFHDLGHRFEYVVPGIRDAEKTFYDRRTDGCSFERLCDIFKGHGYGRDEITKKDSFIHAYMGKDYHGSAYELVSMGFEDAYMNPYALEADPDMQSWIYGLLLLG